MAVIEWLDVFTRPEYKHLILDNLHYCQNNKSMEIIAWCLMSNHLHLIFRSSGKESPGEILRDFKKYTSKQLVKAIKEHPGESRKGLFLARFREAAAMSSNVKDYQFWRHDNKPIELWSNKVIAQKVN
jgi:REP element-mobilizing transposase RayT